MKELIELTEPITSLATVGILEATTTISSVSSSETRVEGKVVRREKHKSDNNLVFII